jgi:O6-methylguanine-DNA--protein-cysteine methyltransferase
MVESVIIGLKLRSSSLKEISIRNPQSTIEMTDKPSAYQLIYDVVNKIPIGKVATYGQIAELAGFYGKARLVGYAL